MLKEEEYKMSGYRPPFKDFNEITSMSNKNMDTNIHTNFDKSLPRSRKVFIQPVSDAIDIVLFSVPAAIFFLYLPGLPCISS